MRDDHPEINNDPYKYVPIKPLYMLIKVDVDKLIVYNQDKAEKYAENHCDKLILQLVTVVDSVGVCFLLIIHYIFVDLDLNQYV